MTDLHISKKLCKQLDGLLLSHLGNHFQITRDAKGNYFFRSSNNHISVVKASEEPNNSSKKKT